MKIKELGCAGHLIVLESCRWKRHTQVGRYRISTVGDYYYQEKRTTLGAGEDSFFETMVFKTTDKQEKNNDGCGCKEVSDWSELECIRYSTAGKAQAGHEKMIKKYLNIKNKKEKPLG